MLVAQHTTGAGTAAANSRWLFQAQWRNSLPVLIGLLHNAAAHMQASECVGTLAGWIQQLSWALTPAAWYFTPQGWKAATLSACLIVHSGNGHVYETSEVKCHVKVISSHLASVLCLFSKGSLIPFFELVHHM
jgi:hypothetical protein